MERKTAAEISNLRPISDEDESFIYSSWLKSYRNSDFAKHITNDIYFEQHADIIKNLLAKSQVVVAVSKEDPNHIYGFAVVEQVVPGVYCLHYVYTKYPFRKFGIAKEMVSSIINELGTKPVLISHAPKFLKHVTDRFKLVYNPYQLGES
jgi:hypothetical protein